MLKEAIYHRYEESLKDLPVRMNPYLPYSRPNFWLSCITINQEAMQYVKPENIRLAFDQENIESRPIWKPMHLQPVFAANEFISVDGDVGSDVFAHGLCLPSDIKVTPEEQDQVLSLIRGMFSEKR
jgi:dTDP-4-amino-4,6-dideoxygalactose transaminase